MVCNVPTLHEKTPFKLMRGLKVVCFCVGDIGAMIIHRYGRQCIAKAGGRAERNRHETFQFHAPLRPWREICIVG